MTRLAPDRSLVSGCKTLAPYRFVAYDSVQAGLPDACHDRHFRAADERRAIRFSRSWRAALWA
jgi:hypothetical protein